MADVNLIRLSVTQEYGGEEFEEYNSDEED